MALTKNIKEQIIKLRSETKISQKDIETKLGITHGQLVFALYNPREKNKQPAKEGFFNVSKRENWLL